MIATRSRKGKNDIANIGLEAKVGQDLEGKGRRKERERKFKADCQGRSSRQQFVFTNLQEKSISQGQKKPGQPSTSSF